MLRLRQRLRDLCFVPAGLGGPQPNGTYNARVVSFFRRVDRDQSGGLDYLEFRSSMRRMGKITTEQLSDASLRRVFNMVDADARCGTTVSPTPCIAWVGTG